MSKYTLSENNNHGGGNVGYFPPTPPPRHMPLPPTGRAPLVPPEPQQTLPPYCSPSPSVSHPGSPDSSIYMPRTPPQDDHPLHWVDIEPDGSVRQIYPLPGQSAPEITHRHPAGWIPVPTGHPNPFGHRWMSPPRRLERIRQLVFSPDNVYKNRPPVDISGITVMFLVHGETKGLVPVEVILEMLLYPLQRLKCSRMGAPNSLISY
jgi:hypothetical protein